MPLGENKQLGQIRHGYMPESRLFFMQFFCRAVQQAFSQILSLSVQGKNAGITAEEAFQRHFSCKCQEIRKGIPIQRYKDSLMAAGACLAGLMNLVSVNEHKASACDKVGPSVNEIIPFSLQQIVYLIFIVEMFAGHGKGCLPADAVYGNAVCFFSI